MDETFTAVTKQVVDDRQGLLLRVGDREYYRYGEDPRWFAQRANEECQAEELGRPTTAADRFKLCPSELAMQLYYRDDSVAVAAVREALDRPYLNYGTLRSVFGGTLECC